MALKGKFLKTPPNLSTLRQAILGLFFDKLDMNSFLEKKRHLSKKICTNICMTVVIDFCLFSFFEIESLNRIYSSESRHTYTYA